MKEKFNYIVGGVYSIPFIALFAIGKLIAGNPTNAGKMTFTTFENNYDISL